jgi:hypothetical protein
MNIAKHMEAIFVAAAVLATASAFATANEPAIQVAARAPVLAAQADSKMPVVVVSAKRLSAAEKAALI